MSDGLISTGLMSGGLTSYDPTEPCPPADDVRAVQSVVSANPSTKHLSVQ